MKKGRVAVIEKPGGKVIIKEYPLPDPAPGTLLIKIELCGVCGTDVHTYNGHMPDAPFPIILGHEIVGKVIALGKGVKTDYLGKPINVGDRVTMDSSVIRMNTTLPEGMLIIYIFFILILISLRLMRLQK